MKNNNNKKIKFNNYNKKMKKINKKVLSNKLIIQVKIKLILNLNNN